MNIVIPHFLGLGSKANGSVRNSCRANGSVGVIAASGLAVMSVLCWENYRKIGKITIKVPIVPVPVSKPFVTLRPEKMQSYTLMLLHYFHPIQTFTIVYVHSLCLISFFCRPHIDLPPK